MEAILPPALFSGMSTPILLLVIAISIAVLGKGADILVDCAVKFARMVGVPRVIIGATLVSLGTTTPEAAVSVLAAFKGMPEFALGNAVGSIICDTGLIFGLCAVLAPLPKDMFVLNRHGWIQIGSAALLVILCSITIDSATGSRVLTRAAGVLLIALLVVYLAVSYYWARQHEGDGDDEDSEKEKSDAKAILLLFAGMVVGITLVILSSHTLIQSVKVTAERAGIPPAIIAATLIAFGTSLPELVTALVSIRKGATDLLVGNIIGADILNVFFVSGASALAAPLLVPDIFFWLHFPAMMIVLIVFRIAIHLPGKTFLRSIGWLLLALYLVYLIADVMIGGGAGAH